ncbi:MAG TPA: L,D-transpeptidase [Devosiaceae bacterium]|nr:L,D-transpeptidase [Devosiaceae bacterium]
MSALSTAMVAGAFGAMFLALTLSASPAYAGPALVRTTTAFGQTVLVPPGMTVTDTVARGNMLAVANPGRIEPSLLRQVLPYASNEAPGTIVVSTGTHFLYLVLPGGKAMRYGIGVARSGFEWSGAHQITAKREWPDWTPPAEMRRRQPDIPAFMPGGPGNPLGARALYIGQTLYRIHGTAEPWTIGTNVSSGCIRLTNEDIIDLYKRVPVGARVVVI